MRYSRPLDAEGPRSACLHRLNFPANVPGHGGERSSFHHEEDPEQQVQYPIGNRGEICPEIDRKGDADKAARDTQPQSGNGLMVSAKMTFTIPSTMK